MCGQQKTKFFYDLFLYAEKMHVNTKGSHLVIIPSALYTILWLNVLNVKWLNVIKFFDINKWVIGVC